MNIIKKVFIIVMVITMAFAIKNTFADDSFLERYDDNAIEFNNEKDDSLSKGDIDSLAQAVSSNGPQIIAGGFNPGVIRSTQIWEIIAIVREGASSVTSVEVLFDGDSTGAFLRKTSKKTGVSNDTIWAVTLAPIGEELGEVPILWHPWIGFALRAIDSSGRVFTFPTFTVNP